ncbi:hypothetical protein C8Q75DRAFT_366791 [Abortiporus biennis]|nr:hypothetical protein C8Q75DRAFT_366791 [Abortiporus biennis]
MSSRPYKRQAQVGQWHDTRAAYTRRRPRLNSDCVLVIMEFLKHSSAASYLANLMLVCKEYHFLGMPFYVNHPQVYTRKYSEKSIRTWHWFLSRRYTVDRLRSDLVLDIIIYRPNLPDRPRDLPPLQFSTIVSLLKDRKDRLRSLTLTDIEELFLLDTEGDLFNAIKSLRALQTFHITCGYARTLELLRVLEAPVRRLQIEFIDRIIWPVPAINMDMIGALSRHSNSLTTIDFSGSYCEVVHSPRTVLPLVKDLRLTVSNLSVLCSIVRIPNGR